LDTVAVTSADCVFLLKEYVQVSEPFCVKFNV